MTDREKVIKAIDICLGNGRCSDCEYHALDCGGRLLRDALALLREQPPTLVYCPNCGAAVEVRK